MDDSIFFFFYNLAHKSALFDVVVTFCAESLIYVMMVLAGVFVVFYQKKLGGCVALLTSIFLAQWIARIFKNLFQTDRPFEIFSQVHTLFPASGYAFPSGHSAIVFAIAFAVFFINKKVGYGFMCLALLVGLARIISGVHFPIDILGGFVVGFSVSASVAYFVKKYKMSISL